MTFSTVDLRPIFEKVLVESISFQQEAELWIVTERPRRYDEEIFALEIEERLRSQFRKIQENDENRQYE